MEDLRKKYGLDNKPESFSYGGTDWSNVELEDSDDDDDEYLGDYEDNETQEGWTPNRLQKKILAGYAITGYSDYTDYSDIVAEHDVSASDEVLIGGLTKLANGEISLQDKVNFLKDIRSPLSMLNKRNELFESIDSEQEKRILAYFGKTGFSNYEDVTVDDFTEFYHHYKTPADFEEASFRMLNLIENSNQDGPKKLRQYKAAMDSFKKKVFGEQCKYWAEMKEIDRVADSPAARIMARGEDDKMTRARYERELSDEWKPGDNSVCQISKLQSSIMTPKLVWNGEMHVDAECQDSAFVNSEQQLYGVFDAVGDSDGNIKLSDVASDIVRELSEKYNMHRPENLASALNRIHEVIGDDYKGSTSGLLTRVTEKDGQAMLAYASVGNSRLYIVDINGNAQLLTKDEYRGDYLGDNSDVDNVRQYGEVPIKKGDRIVLCSKGVYDDLRYEPLSRDDIGTIVGYSHNAEEAAKNLVIEGRDKNDRTALVFAPDFSKI